MINLTLHIPHSTLHTKLIFTQTAYCTLYLCFLYIIHILSYISNSSGTVRTEFGAFLSSIVNRQSAVVNNQQLDFILLYSLFNVHPNGEKGERRIENWVVCAVDCQFSSFLLLPQPEPKLACYIYWDLRRCTLYILHSRFYIHFLSYIEQWSAKAQNGIASPSSLPI